MDSIPERVLEIWQAYYRCEPFGSHWEQTASVAAMISANMTLIAATRGVKTDSVGVIDFMPIDSMPWAKRSKHKSKGLRNPIEQNLVIKQAFGFS